MGQHGPHGDRSWAPRSHEQGACGPPPLLWGDSNYNSFLPIQDQAPSLVLLRATGAAVGQEHQLPEAQQTWQAERDLTLWLSARGSAWGWSKMPLQSSPCRWGARPSSAGGSDPGLATDHPGPPSKWRRCTGWRPAGGGVFQLWTVHADQSHHTPPHRRPLQGIRSEDETTQSGSRHAGDHARATQKCRS